jgi:two-component system response regulator HydG
MLFALHFLAETNTELGKNVLGFTDEVQNILNTYVWYGNLRELKNVIKRATLLTDGDLIEAKSLPFEISNFMKLQFDSPVQSFFQADNNISNNNNVKAVNSSLTGFEHKLKVANIDAEYEVILDALKQANFNKSKAAKMLNIDRKTLYNKMRQFKEFNKD